MRRVVVTGLGLVTPLGGDVETTWANILAAKSGAGTITRQRTLEEPTDSTDVIWRTAVGLTRKEVKGKVMRLLGVAASGLTEETQLALFATTDERRRKDQAAADDKNIPARILAYFGAVQPNAWQCDDAVRAALAMRESLRDYNRSSESVRAGISLVR